MLSFFSIPKAFKGQFASIQHNAILSWKKLSSQIEIILLGDDAGVSQFAQKHKLKHIPRIKRNEFGTPLLNDCFAKAQKKASFSLLTYLNADIILLDDFFKTLDSVKFSQFLLTGRRYQLSLKSKLSFKPGWQDFLKQKLRHKNQDSEGALDYFVFPKKVKFNLPPFAVGRTAWDNWLVYRARWLKLPVVDASQAITAIHQVHDYSHAKDTNVWQGPEKELNWQLAGGKRYFFNLQDANWQFTSGRLEKIPLSFSRLIRSIQNFPVLNPRIGIIAEPLILVFRLIRFVRDKLRT